MSAISPISSRPPEQGTPIVQTSGLITRLPDELKLEFLKWLEFRDLKTCSLVCRNLKQLADDESLWRDLFVRDLQPQKDLSQIQDFQRAYQEERALQSNLPKGVFASRILEGHEEGLLSLAHYKGALFSGSTENAIKAWNLRTGVCTNTLTQHAGAIFCMLVIGENLISGSADNTIRIWDGTTGLSRTLAGHTDSVDSLLFANGMLFSGSHDTTIRMWDINTGECVRTFNGHTSEIYSLVVAEGKLISASDDGTVKVWNIQTGICERTLDGHTAPVPSLAYVGGKLFSASLDGTIRVWNIQTGECLRTLEGHESSVWSLAVAEGYLVSCSEDTIIFWDVDTYACAHILEESTDPWAHSLLYVDGMVISGYKEHFIKIRDFKAPDAVIFKEIARMFRSRHHAEEAMARFSAMPPGARTRIYQEHYRILSSTYPEIYRLLHPNPASPGSAEDAFHDRNGQTSTPNQKAQAIENCLLHADPKPPTQPMVVIAAQKGIKRSISLS